MQGYYVLVCSAPRALGECRKATLESSRGCRTHRLLRWSVNYLSRRWHTKNVRQPRLNFDYQSLITKGQEANIARHLNCWRAMLCTSNTWCRWCAAGVDCSSITADWVCTNCIPAGKCFLSLTNLPYPTKLQTTRTRTDAGYNMKQCFQDFCFNVQH